ncbi:MAG: hypothetical protein IJB52_03720 [Clostridia bacterium]|nr:hypothetical protein [Clostridia bacterium]
MNQLELKEFRHLRWKYLRHGNRRILYQRRYAELLEKFQKAANGLSERQKEILFLYYYAVHSIVYIAMRLNYSERTVQRHKRTIIKKIEGECDEQ